MVMVMTAVSGNSSLLSTVSGWVVAWVGWLISQLAAVSKANRIITIITRFIGLYLKAYLNGGY